MEYAERVFKCKDCKQPFAFTGPEQQTFSERGLTHAPSRCPKCREVRAIKMAGVTRSSRDMGPGERVMFTVTCAECGKEARVPFEPKADRPVYCRDCYSNHKSR